MFNRDAFKSHLEWAESLELLPYKDSVGKLTIGVGRNLDDRGISRAEAMYLLANDIDIVLKDCRRLAYWDALHPDRQLVVADMVFNLGLPKFLRFKRLNGALEIHDYVLAAHEMQDSKWYKQVGRRAKKLVAVMASGEWKDG